MEEEEEGGGGGGEGGGGGGGGGEGGEGGGWFTVGVGGEELRCDGDGGRGGLEAERGQRAALLAKKVLCIGIVPGAKGPSSQAADSEPKPALKQGH